MTQPYVILLLRKQVLLRQKHFNFSRSHTLVNSWYAGDGVLLVVSLLSETLEHLVLTINAPAVLQFVVFLTAIASSSEVAEFLELVIKRLGFLRQLSILRFSLKTCQIPPLAIRNDFVLKTPIYPAIFFHGSLSCRVSVNRPITHRITPMI